MVKLCRRVPRNNKPERRYLDNRKTAYYGKLVAVVDFAELARQEHRFQGVAGGGVMKRTVIELRSEQRRAECRLERLRRTDPLSQETIAVQVQLWLVTCQLESARRGRTR